MSRDNTTLLDILRAGTLIGQFLDGVDRTALEQNIMLQSAVMHQLMVLEETISGNMFRTGLLNNVAWPPIRRRIADVPGGVEPVIKTEGVARGHFAIPSGIIFDEDPRAVGSAIDVSTGRRLSRRVLGLEVGDLVCRAAYVVKDDIVGL